MFCGWSSVDRSFIQSDYLKLKQANPDLKVLIREAKDIPPRAFARFGNYLHYDPLAPQFVNLGSLPVPTALHPPFFPPLPFLAFFP
jgi:hypothetical protein